MKTYLHSMLLLFLATQVTPLTPGEQCELCQIVLRTVYGHFSAAVPSRKKLTHQLKHECNRHYVYRRRCLMAFRDQGDSVFREMTGGDFKPIKICFVLKECKRLQSPLPDDVNATAIEGAYMIPDLPPYGSTTASVTLNTDVPEFITLPPSS